MSNITNDGLTRSGTGCIIYPYGNSGRRQRAKQYTKEIHQSTRHTNLQAQNTTL